MTGMIFVQYFGVGTGMKYFSEEELQSWNALAIKSRLMPKLKRPALWGLAKTWYETKFCQFMVQRWDRKKLSLSKLFIVDGGELPDFSFPLNATVSYMSYFHHFYRHVWRSWALVFPHYESINS